MFMLGVGSLHRRVPRRSRPRRCAAAEESVAKATIDLDFVRIDAEAFAKAPNISVDYAIFEKTKKAAVLPVSFALVRSRQLGRRVEGEPARTRTATSPPAPSPSTTPANRSSSPRRPTSRSSGLDDVVVIASEDAIYVGRLREAQRVGPMVKTLKQQPDDRGAHRNPPHHLPAVGRLFLDPQRRALPGEAALRQARQAALAAEAPPPLRALGRGARHRRGDASTARSAC